MLVRGVERSQRTEELEVRRERASLEASAAALGARDLAMTARSLVRGQEPLLRQELAVSARERAIVALGLVVLGEEALAEPRTAVGAVGAENSQTLDVVVDGAYRNQLRDADERVTRCMRTTTGQRDGLLETSATERGATTRTQDGVYEWIATLRTQKLVGYRIVVSRDGILTW